MPVVLACGKVGKVGAVHSQHAAGKTYGKTRTVGDGHGDETCQNGQHIAKGCAAHRLEEGGNGGVHAEVCGVDAVIIQQEGQRDHNAAAHHEGQHMGNAVHQVLVQSCGRSCPCRKRHPRLLRRPRRGNTGTSPCAIFLMSSSGLWMPSSTRVNSTGLPSKRAVSTFFSAATIIPSQAAISARVRIFFAPSEPLVSTLVGRPSLSPALVSASAAM